MHPPCASWQLSLCWANPRRRTSCILRRRSGFYPAWLPDNPYYRWRINIPLDGTAFLRIKHLFHQSGTRHHWMMIALYQSGEFFARNKLESVKQARDFDKNFFIKNIHIFRDYFFLPKSIFYLQNFLTFIYLKKFNKC